MDMKQMIAGAGGAGMGAEPDDMSTDAKMVDMMTQMRSMLDQMIQMMGAEGKQAGFESVDQGM